MPDRSLWVSSSGASVSDTSHVGTGAFTVAVWAWINTYHNNYDNIITVSDPSGPTTGGAFIQWDHSYARLSLRKWGFNWKDYTNDWAWRYFDPQPTAESWNYYVIQWDGTTNANCFTAKIWNGTVWSNIVSDLAPISGTVWNVFMLGNDPFDTTRYLHGRLAYARQWDAVLSEAELDRELASKTAVRTSNLRYDWPLQDNTSSGHDISGNGYDPTFASTSVTPPPYAGPNVRSSFALSVNGGDITRTTNVGTGAYTAGVWFYLNAAPTNNDEHVILLIHDETGPNTGGLWIEWNTTGHYWQMSWKNSSQVYIHKDLSWSLQAQQWYYLVVQWDGTYNSSCFTTRLWDGSSWSSSVSSDDNYWSSLVHDYVTLGNYGGTRAANIRYAYFRWWDAVLTLQELQAELKYYFPVRRTNLRFSWPLQYTTATGTDISGNGYDPTLTSVALRSGPSAVTFPSPYSIASLAPQTSAYYDNALFPLTSLRHVAGDVLVACVSYNKQKTGGTGTSGWTLIGQELTDTSSTCEMYAKVADGTETSFGISGLTGIAGAVWELTVVFLKLSGLASPQLNLASAATNYEAVAGNTLRVPSGTATVTSAAYPGVVISLIAVDTESQVLLPTVSAWGEFLQYGPSRDNVDLAPAGIWVGYYVLAGGQLENMYEQVTFSSGSDQLSGIQAVIYDKIVPDHEQEGYRWRNDDGSESAATWKQVQDLMVNSTPGSALRLRVISDFPVNPPSGGLTLQYKKAGSPDEEWETI
jgi:hypothetical protein